MLVFLDTEFTDFKRLGLISLAFVAEDDDGFTGSRDRSLRHPGNWQ